METEVILEIEDVPVVCKREELINNSDYFKAMLEGNFVERNQQKIKLMGVNLKAMNIVLTLLWDETFLVENEDLLSVLQVACMLQFAKIKNLCLEKITEMLCPINCLEVWHVTQQLDIKPLFLKAKAMALEEFLQVRGNDYLLEFNLTEICHYLGHIYLKTDNELSVFQTAMSWWYQNGDQYIENSTKILLKLLSCIVYQNLLEHHLKEIMTYPDVASNSEVTQILTCMLSIKGGKPLADFSEDCQETAHSLCRSRGRISPFFLCILGNLKQSTNGSKKARISEEEEQTIIYYDKFRRKRCYEILDNNKNCNSATIYFDHNLKEFKKCFDIDGRKCQNLSGYKLIGYKEFVFMYGGEFLIGKGNWNSNFWVYDTIRERWERKSVLPFVRRHFETCMVGNPLYIVGGSGMYRLLQENMFYYNYKDDRWSRQIAVPCASRQFKCCNFLNKLFILSLSEKCGYFFDEDNVLWEKLNITCDDIVGCRGEFSIFSYKDSLYVKGKNLIEFIAKDEELVVVSIKNITNMCCEKMEVALCHDTVYTLYRYRIGDNDAYSLETYNLENGDKDFVFKYVSNDEPLEVEGDQYTINSSLNMFPFQCYTLVEENQLVNDYFE